MRTRKPKASSQKGGHKAMLLITSLLVAVVLFIVLTIIQGAILDKDSKMSVYQAVQPIEIGTKITDSNFDLLFRQANVSDTMVPSDPVVDKEQLVGKFVTRDYVGKDIVTMAGIADTRNEYLAQINDPVEISISLADLGKVAGGIIREGDYIDIYGLLAPETGNKAKISSDYYFRHIYVNKAYTSSGEEVVTSIVPSTMLNLIISKADAESFVEMTANCTVLYVAKILPELGVTDPAPLPEPDPAPIEPPVIPEEVLADASSVIAGAADGDTDASSLTPEVVA